MLHNGSCTDLSFGSKGATGLSLRAVRFILVCLCIAGASNRKSGPPPPPLLFSPAEDNPSRQTIPAHRCRITSAGKRGNENGASKLSNAIPSDAWNGRVHSLHVQRSTPKSLALSLILVSHFAVASKNWGYSHGLKAVRQAGEEEEHQRNHRLIELAELLIIGSDRAGGAEAAPAKCSLNYWYCPFLFFYW